MNLFDTDVIVELLRKREYRPGAISIVTVIEVLRGLDAEKSPRVKELIEESFNLLTIDNKVVQTYCDLYRSLKEEGVLIPDPDLLIAATAMCHNIPLETKDRHFKRLENLGLKLAQQPQK